MSQRTIPSFIIVIILITPACATGVGCAAGAATGTLAGGGLTLRDGAGAANILGGATFGAITGCVAGLFAGMRATSLERQRAAAQRPQGSAAALQPTESP